MDFKLTRTSVKESFTSCSKAKEHIIGTYQRIIDEQYKWEFRMNPFDKTVSIFIKINTIASLMYLQSKIGYPLII